MAKKLALVNGIARMVDESASPTIYDESLTVVESGAGAGEINGPISAGTNVTLPSSKIYEDDELEIYINGQRIEAVFDYNYIGTIPRTQISLTFDLEVGDIIRFRIDRGA